MTGTLPLGNSSHGITLDAAPFALIRIGPNIANAEDVSAAAAVLFQIGASTPNAPNVVAYNGGAGVWVVNGTGVLISSNSIHSNGGLGIDLGSLGVLANDTLDADLGANLGQNYPVITLATTSGGSTTIQGVLDSAPNKTYSVELFSNSVCNGAPPNDHGEGRSYLSAVQVQTDAGGHAAFQKVVPGVPIDAAVTATATDPDGNTSEFSQCRTAVASTPTPTPTPTPAITVTPGGPTFTPTPTVVPGPPDLAVSLSVSPEIADSDSIELDEVHSQGRQQRTHRSDERARRPRLWRKSHDTGFVLQSPGLRVQDRIAPARSERDRLFRLELGASHVADGRRESFSK